MSIEAAIVVATLAVLAYLAVGLVKASPVKPTCPDCGHECKADDPVCDCCGCLMTE